MMSQRTPDHEQTLDLQGREDGTELLGTVSEERVQERLNRFGTDGWERVSTDRDSMDALLLLVFMKEV